LSRADASRGLASLVPAHPTSPAAAEAARNPRRVTAPMLSLSCIAPAYPVPRLSCIRLLSERPRRYHAHMPFCEHCAYDLAGISVQDHLALCPECGRSSDVRKTPEPVIPWWH